MAEAHAPPLTGRQTVPVVKLIMSFGLALLQRSNHVPKKNQGSLTLMVTPALVLLNKRLLAATALFSNKGDWSIKKQDKKE
jgi:hypothetical protein